MKNKNTNPFSETTLFEQIEKNIRSLPNNIAIKDNHFKLSYAELDNKALRIVSILKEHNVSPEHTVGISMSRSVLLPLTLYSILRYGCCYLFLDPSSPLERLNYMMNAAKIKFLISDDENINRFSMENKICLTYQDISKAKASEKSYPETSDRPAYIMFTSGSTGLPKAIKINHKRLGNYLFSISERMALDTSDIYLHTASFSFSASMRQFLVPLINGATLYISSDQDILNPIKLADLIKENLITIIDTNQSFWVYSLDLLEEYGMINFLKESQIKTIAFSGAALDYYFVNTLRSHYLYKGKIFNIYGMTEMIGVASYCIKDSDITGKSGTVPIGKAYRETHYFIEPDGQLNVSMPGMTKGYLNHESKAFYYYEDILYYRTGDIVSETEGKILTFKGRLDGQVQINGRRVELSEIESVIKSIDGVKDITAIYKDNFLIAYLCVDLSKKIFEKTIIEIAEQKLPHWMIPHQIRLIENFPKLPNFKVDRKAFHEINFYEKNKQTFSPEFKKYTGLFYAVAKNSTENETEKKLYNIWRELLNKNEIGFEDDFFEIGGDSLLAIRLALKIKKTFKTDISIEKIYEDCSIRSIASFISKEEHSKDIKQYDWAFLIHTGSENKTLFWCGDFKPSIRTHIQKHTVYGFKNYYLPLNDLPCHPDSIEEFAGLYLKDILSIQPHGPYYLAGFSAEAILAFEVSRLLNKKGEKTSVFLLDPAKTRYQIPVNNSVSKKKIINRNNNLKNREPFKLRSAEIFQRMIIEIKSFINRLIRRLIWIVERTPSYVIYLLFQKKLIKKMYWREKDFGYERNHELIKKFSVVHTNTIAYLVQSKEYIRKLEWKKFLGNTCQKWTVFDSKHLDMINNETIVKQWAVDLEKMMQNE